MAEIFDTFEKKHDYLICVDSDGCAMDTMDIKHFRCFGPCMVDEWGLDAWRGPILERWNEINLYTMTRGVNRFKGLAQALSEIDAKYTPVDGAAEFAAWAKTAKELSNASVGREAENGAHPIFAKALAWSKAVNESIRALPAEEVKPFGGAKEGLAAAHAAADVAVVSSANRGAVEEEWNRFGLAEHVDILLAQDAGTKAHCIAELLKKGYDPKKVLMVGDAPGDKDAADANGVWYYPILVRHESGSWEKLRTEGIAHLLDGTYEAFGAECVREFYHNLGQD